MRLIASAVCTVMESVSHGFVKLAIKVATLSFETAFACWYLKSELAGIGPLEYYI